MQRDIFHAEMETQNRFDETSDNVYTLLPKEFATQWKENDKVGII